MNRKAEILYQLGEPLAAGMFEEENAAVAERYGRGLRRYFEHAAIPPDTSKLYPAPEVDIWRLAGRFVLFHYSASFSLDANGLRQWGMAQLSDPFDKNLLESILAELGYWQTNLITPRYAIGGNAFTHSILNYRRILREGLGAYRKRVAAMPHSPLKKALTDTLSGIASFLRRTPGDIARCVNHPARDFRSAMRSFNFFFALDCYDSAGRFDEYMGEYYRGEADAQTWVEELYRAVDMHDGWHFIHTGKYPDFTLICIRSQTLRRPNSGLLIGPETPQAIWDALFDRWAAGIPSPSVYNLTAYQKGIRRVYGKHAALDRFAFGGCTELMFEGCSNVGSIEAGINLLDILNHSTPQHFHRDICRHLDELAAAVKANCEFAARNRPQLIRTLFIDDCIDRNLEYNAGGARYCAGVVNTAGLTDAANTLAALSGVGGKFGNDLDQVDDIATDLARFVFGEIRRRRMRHGGPALPAVIMFTTYAFHGSYVGKTADGRADGAPLADSAGAATGTDRQGPTALINSVTKLPGELGIGTLVLNIRLARSLASDSRQRPKLQALLQGFLAQGGLQLQPTLIDSATLQKAYQNPDGYPELIVRIGGYSEYFNRLSRELQLAVLQRVEQNTSSN